jgi:hypothetical protein
MAQEGMAFVKDLIVIPSLVGNWEERRNKFRLLKPLVLKE